VDRHQLLPVDVGKVLDRIDDLDAGIGHEDVDAAEFSDRVVDAGLDRRFVGHVHDDGGRPDAARLDLVGCGLRGSLVDVGDRDVRAIVGQHLGDALADATRGASD
jgi:hypothetical protein